MKIHLVLDLPAQPAGGHLAGQGPRQPVAVLLVPLPGGWLPLADWRAVAAKVWLAGHSLHFSIYWLAAARLAGWLAAQPGGWLAGWDCDGWPPCFAVVKCFHFGRWGGPLWPWRR